MPLTGTGNTGKTVVYTDRELNRQLLKHYTPDTGDPNDPSDTGDMTRLPFATTAVGTTAAQSGGVIPVIDKNWKVTHGFSSSITVAVQKEGESLSNQELEDKNVPAVKTATSYFGSLHSVSGRFVCEGTCEVKLMPTYGTADATTKRRALKSVAGSATDMDDDTTAVYFKPTSPTATIALYEGGPVGVDTEYLMFGYWREDPTSPAGTYSSRPSPSLSSAEAVRPSHLA